MFRKDIHISNLKDSFSSAATIVVVAFYNPKLLLTAFFTQVVYLPSQLQGWSILSAQIKASTHLCMTLQSKFSLRQQTCRSKLAHKPIS